RPCADVASSLLLFLLVARPRLPRRHGHRRGRLALVQHDEVAQDLFVQLQRTLELRQRLRGRAELCDNEIAVRLLADRVGELPLPPVVDRGDLAAAVAGHQRVEAVQLLADGRFGQRRVEDVDDLVVPHGIPPLDWTAPSLRGGAGVCKARKDSDVRGARPPPTAAGQTRAAPASGTGAAGYGARYTLNRKSMMSPSWTTYSRPSLRISPRSRAALSEPASTKSAQLRVSARMKPRSKSEWISPAASGARVPSRMVQARTSFSPAVKKLMRPSRR